MNPKVAQNFDSLAANLDRRRNMRIHNKTLHLLEPLTHRFTREELSELRRTTDLKSLVPKDKVKTYTIHSNEEYILRRQQLSLNKAQAEAFSEQGKDTRF